MPFTKRYFAIVPAAGESRRMGTPKLLLPWRDNTVIDKVLHTWTSSGVTATVVTVRPDDERLADRCRRAGVDVVVPAIPPGDMKQSVLFGLSHIAARFTPDPGDAWLLAPADMPLLTAESIHQVIRTYESDTVRNTASPIVVPRFAGRRGHPVLFSWSLAEQVQTLKRDEGINTLLAQHVVTYVDVEDQGITIDLDTPDDYEQLRSDER